MRSPIVKRKKVSFMNLVKELERVKPRLGNNISLFVEVSYQNFSHSGNIYLKYSCTYINETSVIFKAESLNPNELIYEVEKHLKQSEPIIVNDVII